MVRTFARREFLKLSVLVAGTGVLVSCAPKATPTPQPKVEKATAAPKAPTEKITLQHWYHEYGEAGCQEAVYRIAEEYTNMQDEVKVEVTWTPGAYADKLNTALAAGTGPDVYEHQLRYDHVRNKWAVELDDIINPVKDDFAESVLAQSTLEGHLWSIRMLIDTGVVYYRKSMLDEAGISEPQTFSELFEAAKNLTTERRKGLFVGNDGGGIMQNQMAGAVGVRFVDYDAMVLDFNPPVLAAAWEKARELHHAGYLLIGSPTDWWDPGAFTQGLCAMCWGGLWMMPEVERRIGDDFFVNAWPPVHVEGGTPQYSTFLGGWQQFVNAQSEHVSEAKELVKWMWIDNTDWQNEWNTAYGFHVPPRKRAKEANEKYREGNPKIAAEAMEKYGWDQGPMWNSAMGTALGDAYWHVVRDKEDAATEIQTAYDKCKQELAGQLK